MQLTGADILIRTLIEQGCDTVFGYPGGQILNVYDSLYKYQNEIRHMLTAHEQGAAHAADGYARATGKVGVVMSTSGPGATNLVTGIATAYLDSIPLVAICGNVPTKQIGTDSFQEIDITGVTLPITKHNYFVGSVENLADTIREAFALAQSGRPGPVLIDVPKDVQTAVCDYEPQAPVQPEERHAAKDVRIKEAAALINVSKRPFIYFGGGLITSEAQEEMLALAEKIDAPIGCSLMGLSGIPTDDPRFLGMQGMHGHYASSMAMHDADLIISLGVRFNDRVTGNPKCFGANAKVIHLEIDPAEIDKIVHADVAVVGDVKQTLPLLTQRIRPAAHKAWIEGFRACDKVEYEAVVRKAIRPEGGRIRMGEVVDTVAHAYDNDAVLVTDVGQQQMFAARYFGFRRSRSLVTSGGLGTMGFGLPAAIGAKLGAPDREVCLFAGDGGLQMTIQELGTIFQSQVAVKIVLLNNSYLGMVRQWQELFYDRRYSFTELANPDFGLIARGNGIAYRCVERREELAGAVAEMKACKGAYLLEVRVESEENVFPMVPAGAPVSAIRLE